MTSQLTLLHFSRTDNEAALDTKAEQEYEERTTACGTGNHLGDTSGYPTGYLRELRWVSNLLEALEERAERKRREKTLKRVHIIVARLEATRPDGASRDEILAAAEVSGISRKEAEKALEALLAQGDIFECRKGRYKTT